jgi:hypothetical protein
VKSQSIIFDPQDHFIILRHDHDHNLDRKAHLHRLTETLELGGLWMLPYPESVNQEDGSYLILGHNGSQVRVTKENWETLRFNTRTLNPEYFPASYLNPVPTGPSLETPLVNATFPRSTITGTVEELRQLLKVPLLVKSEKIFPEIFQALSLEGPTEAPNGADERTAPKRIRVFLKLCSVFVPCKYDDYCHAVSQLDVELNPDFLVAVQPVRDEILVNITNRIETATSVLLQVLYTLQQGHVQYLLRQYRIALVDQFGPARSLASRRAISSQSSSPGRRGAGS